eukprot:9584061-Alexandrium_andersonii.AAC.1
MAAGRPRPRWWPTGSTSMEGPLDSAPPRPLSGLLPSDWSATSRPWASLSGPFTTRRGTVSTSWPWQSAWQA